MKLKFSKFKNDDFSEYKSWYVDLELNKRLGPMNNMWLDHVMNATGGCQYSVFHNKKLIAVVGIIFPDAKHSSYYITDFALKPHLRNQGIGSEVLKEMMNSHPLKSGQSWKAFIDERNPKAKSFFEKNGWSCLSKTTDKHGMFTLEFSESVA